MNSDSGPADDAARRAVRNLSKMTTGRIAAQLVLVASALAIPTILGIDEFGLYAAVMALVVILETLSSGGLHLVEIRYVAPVWQEGDVAEAEILASTIWLARLILGMVFGGVAAVWLAGSTSLELGAGFIALAVLLVISRSALEATRHLFLSFGEVGVMVAFEVLRATLVLAMVVALFGPFGLTAVFGGLVLGHVLLLAVAFRRLNTVALIRPARASWEQLRPHLTYARSALVGVVAWIIQAHFAVYAVANWVSAAQAGLVGLTVQVYVMGQALLISPWLALQPILAEIDSAGQIERLREWASLMMRWGAGAAVAAAVSWALLGDDILELLPAEFAPAHRSGFIMLTAVVLLVMAINMNSLLWLGGQHGVAAFNTVLFAATSLAGSVAAIAAGGSVADAIGWSYVAAAAVFAAAVYTALVLVREMRLPLRRSVMLSVPLLLGWPALGWGAGLLLSVMACGTWLALFGAYCIGFGLLPREELKRIVANARATGRTIPPATP